MIVRSLEAGALDNDVTTVGASGSAVTGICATGENACGVAEGAMSGNLTDVAARPGAVGMISRPCPAWATNKSAGSSGGRINRRLSQIMH